MFLTILSSLALAQPAVTQSAEKTSPESSRIGLVLNVGPELLVPVEGGAPVRLGARLGGGVRVGLMDREEEGHSTVPALALVGGFLGHDMGDFVPAGYLELRPELVIAKRAGLLQPSLVAYGIGGAMLRPDGAVPYFGIGLGWDLPMFAFDEPMPKTGSGRSFNFGNLGSGAALLPAALIVATAIIGFVLIGRIEVRYYPLQLKGGPAMTAILVGFGF